MKPNATGQLTKSKFYDFNRYIYFRKSNKWKSYSQIYKDAVNKCPIIARKIIPQGMLLDHNPTMPKLKAFNDQANFSCGVTHDIHSCLFYSLYTMKINIMIFNRVYHFVQENPYLKSSSISQQLRDDFQLPIQLNEVVTIKGKATNKITGEALKGEWIATSDEEIYKLFYEDHSYRIIQLES